MLIEKHHFSLYPWMLDMDSLSGVPLWMGFIFMMSILMLMLISLLGVMLTLGFPLLLDVGLRLRLGRSRWAASGRQPRTRQGAAW